MRSKQVSRPLPGGHVGEASGLAARPRSVHQDSPQAQTWAAVASR
jgi:hypothetical protein